MHRERSTWLTGVIALAVTLLILFGGQTAWHAFAVAKPLDNAFEGIDGVQSVTWNKEKNDQAAVVLQVSLDQVANLQTTYSDIQERAKKILGKSAFRIVVHDDRNPELEQVYHDMHFHIQEAIATGGFGDMAGQINKQAAAAGVNAQVYVDSSSVYLQLSQGEADLYRVIPRANGLTGVK